MNIHHVKNILIFVNLNLLLAVMLILVACEDVTDGPMTRGTETGDPTFSVSLSSFDQTAMMDYFIPKAYAAVTGVEMCIFEIRFYADQNSVDPGVNSSFELGLVTLDPNGTSLGDIGVAYRRSLL